MIQAKNSNLFAYHNEIEGWKGSALEHLLKGRIDNFYNKNKLRIDSLNRRLRGLQEKYFVIENEEVKIDPDPEKKGAPLMLEGMLYENYMTDFKELMNQDVQIIF